MLHSQALPPLHAGGIDGVRSQRASPFGEGHLLAWGWWAGLLQTWAWLADHLGSPCEEDGCSSGWREGEEELNDLWQSLRSPGLSGFFPD